jgi:hypothetical protein
LGCWDATVVRDLILSVSPQKRVPLIIDEFYWYFASVKPSSVVCTP